MLSLSRNQNFDNHIFFLQVVIEGVRGDNYDGDIALDDVSFTTSCVPFYGQLPIAPIPSPTPKPVTPPSQCSTAEFNCVKEGPNACIPSTQASSLSSSSILYLWDVKMTSSWRQMLVLFNTYWLRRREALCFVVTSSRCCLLRTVVGKQWNLMTIM